MSDLFVVGDGPPNDGRPDAPFQILCLSGGGYRGLYTALVLEHLERRTTNPARQLASAFDLIAGTSIGGILAIGLAAGVAPSHLREIFAKSGKVIFPRWRKVAKIPVFPNFRTGVFRQRYASDGLRATVEAVLEGAPKSPRKLGDIDVPLLVACVDATNNQPRLFDSRGADSAVSLIDIALATSAAPTYFPEHKVGEQVLVDGGLIANAPDALALGCSIGPGRSPDNIRMISIGTADGADAEAARSVQGRGWLTGARYVFDLTLTAQEALSTELARRQLGERYLRLDETPSPDQRAAIGLDRPGKTSAATLTILADKTKDRLTAHDPFLRDVLNRTAPRAG